MQVFSERGKADSPRILVFVEDPDVRQVLQDLLQCEGYELELASTRKELEDAPAHHYRAAIIDVALYDASKLLLVQQLGKSAFGLPMIIFTGHNSDDDRVRSLHLSHVETIRKPYDTRDLKILVQKVIARTPGTRLRSIALHSFVPVW